MYTVYIYFKKSWLSGGKPINFIYGKYCSCLYCQHKFPYSPDICNNVWRIREVVDDWVSIERRRIMLLFREYMLYLILHLGCSSNVSE